jgi:predicted DNA-binding protein
MSEMSANIRRVTEDLNNLLKRLSGAEGPEAAKLIEQALTLQVMQDFKLAVDAMRHLLWIYIEAASRATVGDINDSIHGLRLQRATEILRGLREGGIPISRRLPEGRSFIEQVEALVNYYSQQEPQPARIVPKLGGTGQQH